MIAGGLLAAIVLLQRGGLFGGAGNWSSSVTRLTWLPMFVFQVALAVWLIAKGVAAPVPKQPSLIAF